MPALQVVTTIDSNVDAQKLALMLVERRLAACVQVVGPVKSTYRWEEKIETAEEWLCLIRTVEERYPELEAAIKEIHSYDVPEILATPVVAGNAEYLLWLSRACAT